MFGFSHYSDPIGSDFLVGSYRPQLIASSSATHVCSPLLSRSLASIVGNRVVSDAYKMRAFLCDTRTWGRGSAPLEEGHRPCRLSWDKKVVVSGPLGVF